MEFTKWQLELLSALVGEKVKDSYKVSKTLEGVIVGERFFKAFPEMPGDENNLKALDEKLQKALQEVRTYDPIKEIKSELENRLEKVTNTKIFVTNKLAILNAYTNKDGSAIAMYSAELIELETKLGVLKPILDKVNEVEKGVNK